ncbi:dihydroorotate dehydrogenase electron transfer subunit [Patescibacteria group bacterium]
MDVKKLDTRPVGLQIKKIIQENESTRTFIFDYNLDAKPGQFVMMWIPGVDEKPFSVSFSDENEFWLTICKVGPATEELFKLKEGDKVGIRGPFGTYYEFEEGDHLALISGGYGAAPMYFVAREAIEKGCEVEFFVGARNEKLLLFTQKVLALGSINLHIATDDGSMGHKGFVTDILEKLLDEKKIDRIFSCGPERMMQTVGNLAEKAGSKFSLSMERYMKCGFGVCGQCVLDDTGICVCKNGPVMEWEYVKKLPEFAKYHRDAQGKKHYY